MKTLKELISNFIGVEGKTLEEINTAFVLSGFEEFEIRYEVREGLLKEEFILSGMSIKVAPSSKKSTEVKPNKDGNVKLPYVPPAIPVKSKDPLDDWLEKIKKLLDEESKTAPVAPYKPYFPDGVYYPKSKCTKCGIELDRVMGYVCGDSHCPTFPKAWC